MTQQGTIYLLHFSAKVADHAGHYLGWASDLDSRLAQHAAGTGARLTAECVRLAGALREAIGVSSVVIHRLHFAVSHGPGGAFSAAGPYCERPLKSTGAGDRFNAGYCLGLLAGADPEACLDLGSATSGFFVRNASSGTRTELLEFLRRWRAGDY